MTVLNKSFEKIIYENVWSKTCYGLVVNIIIRFIKCIYFETIGTYIKRRIKYFQFDMTGPMSLIDCFMIFITILCEYNLLHTIESNLLL